MKKWIITILLALTLMALALATHFWGARVIKFAVENDKTVDSLKRLLELLIAIGGLAVPVIKWGFGRAPQPPPPQAPADPKPRLDEYVPKPRVLDAAIPSHVVKDRPTELLILVRLPESAGLNGALLADEDAEARPEDVVSKPFKLIFLVGPDGKPDPIRVAVRLTSLDFSPPDQTKILFVPPDADSEVCHFLLTPTRIGRLRVLIELQWQEAIHGSRSLLTECVAEAENVPENSGMNLAQLQMSASALLSTESSNKKTSRPRTLHKFGKVAGPVREPVSPPTLPASGVDEESAAVENAAEEFSNYFPKPFEKPGPSVKPPQHPAPVESKPSRSKGVDFVGKFDRGAKYKNKESPSTMPDLHPSISQSDSSDTTNVFEPRDVIRPIEPIEQIEPIEPIEPTKSTERPVAKPKAPSGPSEFTAFGSLDRLKATLPPDASIPLPPAKAPSPDPELVIAEAPTPAHATGLTMAGSVDWRAAVHHYEQELANARERGDRRGVAAALGILVLAYEGPGDHHRALEYCTLSVRIARELGDRRAEGHALWKASLILYQLGDHRKAIARAEAAHSILEEVGDPTAAKIRKQLDLWEK